MTTESVCANPIVDELIATAAFYGMAEIPADLRATLEEIAADLTEELAPDFDPASLSDPATVGNLLGQGVIEPKATPVQTQALERLQTLLGLIDGWVRAVAAAALGDRIPGDTRDGMWQHPDLLADADDLDEPAGLIDRVIGDDTRNRRGHRQIRARGLRGPGRSRPQYAGCRRRFCG